MRERVTIYRGVDLMDSEDVLIAVRGGMMRVSTYLGEDDPWLENSFVFERGMPMPVDMTRFDNLVTIKIIAGVK